MQEDELESCVKDLFTINLRECTKNMDNCIAMEKLTHIFNELVKRIEKLENESN